LLWHIKLLEDLDINESHRMFLFALRNFFTIELLLSINDTHQYRDLATVIGGAVFEPRFARPFALGDYLTHLKRSTYLEDQFQIPTKDIDDEETIREGEKVLVWLAEFLKKKVDVSKSTKKEYLSDVRFTKIFLAVTSFLYFGKGIRSASKRIGPQLWYNQSANFAGSTVTTYALFDFWAFLFWVSAPDSNLRRIFGDDEEGYQELLKSEGIISIVNRTKGHTLFSALMQIELLEHVANGTLAQITSKRKEKTNRSLWIDIQDLSDAFLRTLVFASTGKFQKSKMDSYREEFWGLSPEDWVIFGETVDEIQRQFIEVKNEEIAKSTENFAEVKVDIITIGGDTKHLELATEPQRKLLLKYKGWFQSYRDNPKPKDRVGKLSRDLIREFTKWILEPERKKILELERKIHAPRSRMALRISFSQENIDLIDEILKRQEIK
jgi:hypothetical protein